MEFSGGNSQLKDSSTHASLATNDVARAERLAVEAGHRYDRVIWRGPIEVPGLIFPLIRAGLVSGYRPGDMAIGITAEAGQAVHDLMFNVNQEEGGAVIAGVDWKYSTGAPGKSPVGSTTLRLEDTQVAVQLGRRG